MPNGRLYYGDLVNRAAPLNRGLTAWWRVMPWYMSGPRWIDIYARNHGDLANGPPTWNGLSHPGGYGSLRFSGGPRVDIASMPASTTTYTIAFWMRPDGTPSDYHCLFGTASGNGLYYNGGKLDLYYGGDHLNTTTLTAGTWTHVGVSVNAGNVTFYVNGKPDGTATGALSFNPARIGNNNDSQSFTGYLDDYRYYVGRSLTDIEFQKLFEASVNGYLNEHNYIRPVRFARAAAGGFNAAWARNHNAYILGGGSL